MLGLNLDCPLLLSTVIEHAATTSATPSCVAQPGETVHGTYRDAALRSRRLAGAHCSVWEWRKAGSPDRWPGTRIGILNCFPA